MQGLEFLDYIIALEIEREWNSGFLRQECVKWLELLVRTVDVTGPRAQECYRKILYYPSELHKENEQSISEQVSVSGILSSLT